LLKLEIHQICFRPRTPLRRLRRSPCRLRSRLGRGTMVGFSI